MGEDAEKGTVRCHSTCRWAPRTFDASDVESENDDTIWIENVVAGAGVAIAVLFVSSLAVVMYLAC